MTTLQQFFYVINYSQIKQGLECKVASMNHAMNPNGKWCIVCIDFCSLECTYHISPKTKEFLLSYRGQNQTSTLLNGLHAHKNQIVSSYSIKNLLKGGHHGNFHSILHHVCMYENVTPNILNAHLITCKGHIVNNRNNDYNSISHIGIHEFNYHPTL